MKLRNYQLKLKKIGLLAIILTSMLFFSGSASAAVGAPCNVDSDCNVGVGETCDPDTLSCVAGGGNGGGTIPMVSARISCLICRIFNLIFMIAGALTALVILIAGIKWIGSGDDPAARGSAKNTIVHAIIGLIIVLVAVYIVSWLIVGFGTMIYPTSFISGCNEICQTT